MYSKVVIQTRLNCASGYVDSPREYRAVLWIRIRIHQIHMFLGLQDPDPLVRGMDPDPSIIMQK